MQKNRGPWRLSKWLGCPSANGCGLEPRASKAVLSLGWMVVPVILLLIWQVAAVWLDQPWIFPPATRVIEQLMHPLREHYASGSLLSNTFISLLRVLLGFLLAAAAGITFGIAMGSIRIVRSSLEPIVELMRPLCPIAWLPFAIAIFKRGTLPQLFGIGYSRTVFDQVQLGMVFVIFVGGFFPILTNTLDGVTGVRRNYLLLARALGATRRQLFLHVYLPASMPMILTGLRQLPGAESGIGYLLIYASDNAAMDIVIAAMLIVGSIGALLSLMMRRIMSGLVRWHGKEI